VWRLDKPNVCVQCRRGIHLDYAYLQHQYQSGIVWSGVVLHGRTRHALTVQSRVEVCMCQGECVYESESRTTQSLI
jgi:hypothetical protein